MGKKSHLKKSKFGLNIGLNIMKSKLKQHSKRTGQEHDRHRDGERELGVTT